MGPPSEKSNLERSVAAAPTPVAVPGDARGRRRGRVASVRELGQRIRPRRDRHPLAETGLTIAGAAVPLVSGDTHAIPTGSEDAVRTEGAAPLDNDRDAIAVWLFASERPPAQTPRENLPRLLTDDENVVWVDLSGYAEDDLRTVARQCGLHNNAVRAALSPWQRPRLSVYADHFFVSVTIPRLDPADYRIHASELDLFVGPNLLVSAHKTALPFAAHLRARALSSPDLVQLDPAFMLYIVIDELLAYYEELNRHVQVQIEQMEERALHDTSDRFLEDLVRFKRYAFALSQLADQHRDVVSAFLRPDFHWISGKGVEEYYEDLLARLTRLLDLLLAARDAVNGSFDIYVSHMAHRTNQVIRLLTIVSVVLFTASIIVSIFGTTLSATIHNSILASPLGLVVMLACIVAVSGGILVVFSRRDWL